VCPQDRPNSHRAISRLKSETSALWTWCSRYTRLTVRVLIAICQIKNKTPSPSPSPSPSIPDVQFTTVQFCRGEDCAVACIPIADPDDVLYIQYISTSICVPRIPVRSSLAKSLIPLG
jgi:hypothetical protein